MLGWIFILLSIGILSRLSLVGIYYFLSVNKPIKSHTLVIEGWVSAYAIKDAVKYIKENNYDRIIVTGLPIVDYEFISSYKSTAEATVLALKHYGYYDTAYVAEVPTNILIDRTYNTAVATKMLFYENSSWPKNFNIYSIGVHARRSRFLFEKAFGSKFNIGIISHRDRTFEPQHWWKSSKGARNVSNEFLATIYTELFFHPDIAIAENSIIEGRYIDSIYYNRQDKYNEFADSLKSPFTKAEREEFTGFNYYTPDINYRVTATFTVDTSTSDFAMKTSTTRTPTYRIYGYLDFMLNDTSCRLTAYQNMDYKDDITYGNELFVPFKDLTNIVTTYGAGRYLDVEIPVSNKVMLDFNEAYNPYCAYSHRWSCPLVPVDNHLNLNISAGEKIYK